MAVRRGRIREYADKYPSTPYTAVDPAADFNPLWDHKADCAFPSATQNEINGRDAQNLVNNGIKAVAEGANMPTIPEGVDIFLDNGLYYAPGKVANAGGVSVSGLEMTQSSMRLSWTREEVDNRLKMKCEASTRFASKPPNGWEPRVISWWGPIRQAS